jgi:protein O-mannosyl-transferase
MRSHWVSILVTAAVLITVTGAIYCPVIRCDFVSFDDPHYVSSNPHVLAGLSAADWTYAWTTLDCTNWHPLTWLSLQLDSSLYGVGPSGYHTTNLVLHAINACLLMVVLRQMTGCLIRSAIVAGLFALHPLHVESVAWISERKDVLSTLFLLLTILMYVRYARRPTVLSYLPVMLMLSLGLLAKPMLVTLPLLLLLLDFWPLNRMDRSVRHEIESPWPQRSLKQLVLEKIPLLVLAVADGLMTIYAQRSAAPALGDLPFHYRLGNLFQAYLWYLQKTLVPTHLTAFYQHPARNLSTGFAVAGFLAVALITGAVIRFGNSRRHLIVGWLWFCVALLPVSGLLQVGSQAYADRYTYVPHLGLFLLIVWEGHFWMPRGTRGRRAWSAVTIAALVACGIVTRIQIGYWQDSKTLWTHALEVDKDNAVAHLHLSDLYLAAGDFQRTSEHLEQGLRTRRGPGDAGAYCNWGKVLLALNRPADAEERFRMALELDGRNEVALDELSKLLRNLGRQSEADTVSRTLNALLSEKLQDNADDAARQLRYGLTLARQGDIQQAIVHFQKAVFLSPDSAVAHNNLALAHSQLNQPQQAKVHFQKAVQLDPNLAAAHFNLAAILAAEHDVAGAKDHYAAALRLNPRDTEAEERLRQLAREL